MVDHPAPVPNRLRRHRARLAVGDVELIAGDEFPGDVDPDRVLVVGTNRRSHGADVSWFSNLRSRLAGRAELMVLAPIVPDDPEPFADRVRARVRRQPEQYHPENVIGALRASGWLVADIERFSTDDGAMWADIVARDLRR